MTTDASLSPNGRRSRFSMGQLLALVGVLAVLAVLYFAMYVEKTGPSPIGNLAVVMYIPEGGEPEQAAPNTRDSANDRNPRFTVPHLDPKQKPTDDFRLDMGKPQLLAISAAALARPKSGQRDEKARLDVDVQGKADVRIKVEEKNRTLDVGEVAEFEIRLENIGDKEALQVSLSAELTKNLQVQDTDHDGKEGAKFDPTSRRLIFPVIPRIAPGNVQRILIRAKAIGPGLAECRLALVQDGEETISQIGYTKVKSHYGRSQK